MAIVDQQMYVCTDAKNNNNKFWEVTLHDSGQVVTRNGRVGATGVTNDLGAGGQGLFNSKIREKERKGYRLVPTVLGSLNSANSVSTEILKTAAQEQIAGSSPLLTSLISKLAEANRHQLLVASGGHMNLNLATGIVSTPVGVVTLSNVQKARSFISNFEQYIKIHDFENPKFVDLVNEYLMLVPQKVGASRGWHRQFLPSNDALIRQNSLLDQLEASIEIAEQEVATKKKALIGEIPKVFDVSIKSLEDMALWKKIEKYFRETVNSRHSCSHLKPKQIFEVQLSAMHEAWLRDGATLDNQQQLWHGTRTHNLLSILKSGLIIPRSGGSIQVTGRMFGDGLYFSDQSSKALNYAYGYWDGGHRDNQCFMFLADVAMGKAYTPSGPTGNRPIPKGFDSTFAKAGKSGVHNNEMIVYRTGQVNLRYLIEFGA